MSADLLSVFDFIRELGEGGGGRVILVKRKNNGQMRALKLLPDNLQKMAIDRFYNIARTVALGSTCYPSLICFHDVKRYTYEGFEYIGVEMDYIEGDNLFDLYNKNLGFRLSEKSAMENFTYVLTAVVYLHDHHIVHRDIKLENIVMGPKGPVLIDLDLACAARAQNPVNGCDWDETRYGTFMYIPPSPRGTKVNFYKVDIYNLAFAFMELLVAQPPSKEFNNLLDSIFDEGQVLKKQGQEVRAANDPKMKQEYRELVKAHGARRDRLNEDNEYHKATIKIFREMTIEPRFKDILLRCTDTNPSLRPTAREVYAVMKTLLNL